MRFSFQTENKAVSMAFKAVAIALAALLVMGVAGCTKQALSKGYVTGFQFESCFVLLLFIAIAILAGYLVNENTNCAVLRKCSMACIALVVVCLIGAVIYNAVRESSIGHYGVISPTIPYGILISGAILVILFLLFRRFIRMKEELEDFV